MKIDYIYMTTIGRSHSRGFRLRSDTRAPLAPGPQWFGSFTSERSSFSVYIIQEEIFLPEREFHSDLKPE